MESRFTLFAFWTSRDLAKLYIVIECISFDREIALNASNDIRYTFVKN